MVDRISPVPLFVGGVMHDCQSWQHEAVPSSVEGFDERVLPLF